MPEEVVTMQPLPANPHAEVNSQEENLRRVKALWSHTLPQIFLVPIHTCQVPHFVRKKYISSFYHFVPCWADKHWL
jgi:hypothetical protein